jgi:signal transduction histidine kinase
MSPRYRLYNEELTSTDTKFWVVSSTLVLLCIVNFCISYVPFIHAYTQFDFPITGFVLSLCAVSCTYALNRATDKNNSVFRILDTYFYMSLLALWMLDTQPPMSYVAGIIFMQAAYFYGSIEYSWRLALAIAANPLVVGMFLIFTGDFAIIVLILFGLLLYVLSARNMTKRQELEKLKEAFILSSQATELGVDLALTQATYNVGVIVHSLSNSLTPVRSFFEIIEEEIELGNVTINDVSLVPFFRGSRESIDKACDLVQNFLSTSKRSIEVNTYWIEPIISRVCEENRIKIVLPDMAHYTYGYSKGLESTLINLICNAKQAGATEISVVLQEKKDKLHVIISDNGKGISKEMQQKLFTSIVDGKKKSNGVGLFLDRKLLRATQSDLVLLKTDISGTVFDLVLNLVKKEGIDVTT